jgi:outer membrane immunogenic protein
MRVKRAMALKAALLMSVAAIAAAPASAAPGTTWTGFYVGASAGYATHQARFEDSDFDWYGSTHQYHSNGAVYGGQVGHNWQTNNVAFGIEADFLGTSIERDQIFAADDFVDNEVNWLATLRARKGFAFGDTFIYQTLGLAVGDFERSWIEEDDVSDSWPDLGDTKVGVVGGFGVERAIGGNWSVRTEAQALRFFGNTSVNPDGYPLTIDDVVYELKAGVNYSFGGQGGGSSSAVAGTPFDFSGFYAGASLGGHMATVQLTDIDFEWYGSTYDLLSEGVAGGLQGGYNTQINGFVYGLEANLNFYGGDQSVADDDGGVDATIDSGLNWGGNVKFKAGAAADNTLMYLSAGLAFLDYDVVRVNVEDGGEVWDLSGTHVGFVASTGLEHAFTPNITGRIEAAYTAVDGDTSDSADDPGFFFRGGAQDVTVMAGVNYYFGPRGALGNGALAPDDWRGFYAGADALLAYHQGSVFDRSDVDHGGNYTLDSFGGGGGLHAGYDWQSDAFVYGVIADIAAFSNDESELDTASRSHASSLNWMGTLRGRAGVATGQALFYATGGLAYGDADLEHVDLSAPTDETFLFDSERFGWTIGLGVEKMMSDRSSFTLETRFTKFGEVSALSGDDCSSAPIFEACQMQGYDDTITVKVGYSLRWGKP